jgi:uncharacterized protein DUF4041/Meiotically Up-regulated Gene 113 (MUG113) protein
MSSNYGSASAGGGVVSTPATGIPYIPANAPSIGGTGGIFGGGKKRLEEENKQLRQEINRLTAMDAAAVAAEAAAIQADLARTRDEYRTLQARLAAIQAELVRTSTEAELQEVGIYEYQHPLADAVAYKAPLAKLNDGIKTMARGKTAVLAATGWTVNGSAAEGRKMINDTSKLMLRAYNAEADDCVARVQPHRLHTTIERLDKVAHTIARLGKTMSIRIAPNYHQLRIQEIRLTADYRAKLEEEKERIREEREREREERAAALEFEREKARLAKEQSHYQAAMTRLAAQGDTVAVAEMEAKLHELEEAIAGVEAREANVRAGYVYVISNIGAFGPKMVKIGMTRRLEPDARIRELGDASVPFRFDTHALIFSEDAVGLEGKLHDALGQQRVNKVNLRREFFYAEPAQVRDALKQIAGQHLLEFRDVPEALEWRASGAHEQATHASFEPIAT